MKMKVIKLQNKWPNFLAIPIFIFIALIFFRICVITTTIIYEYIGGWGLALTMPLYIKFVLEPIINIFWEWYNKRF